MAGCAQQTVVVGSDSWAPNSYQVGKDPVQVAFANANRRGVLIVNDATSSAGPCHVTDKPRASVSIGGRSFPLGVGEGVTINTTADVWVINDDASGATVLVVKVIEEFGAPQ